MRFRLTIALALFLPAIALWLSFFVVNVQALCCSDSITVYSCGRELVWDDRINGFKEVPKCESESHLASQHAYCCENNCSLDYYGACSAGSTLAEGCFLDVYYPRISCCTPVNCQYSETITCPACPNTTCTHDITVTRDASCGGTSCPSDHTGTQVCPSPPDDPEKPTLCPNGVCNKGKGEGCECIDCQDKPMCTKTGGEEPPPPPPPPPETCTPETIFDWCGKNGCAPNERSYTQIIRNCSLVSGCSYAGCDMNGVAGNDGVCCFREPPTVTLNAIPTSHPAATEEKCYSAACVQAPVSSDLYWTTEYAQTCTASNTGGGISGWWNAGGPRGIHMYCDGWNSGITSNLPGGSNTVCPQAPSTTYTLTCTNPLGSTSDSAIVTVGEVPLTVTLSAGNPPSGGNIPLSDVDLTAIVSGGNSADAINYKFYCNSTDSNPDITPPFTGGEFNGETATSKTSIDACDYTTAGRFYPKVVVQRGSLSAAARIPFIANSLACSTGVWESGACGGGACSNTEREWTRTITPACDPMTPTTQCVADATCLPAGTPNVDIGAKGPGLPDFSYGPSITVPEENLPGTIYVDWTSSNVTDCTVTPPIWTGPSDTESETLTGPKVYTLTCDLPGGGTITDSIDVLIAPSGGGDTCEVVLTKLPVNPTCTRIKWQVKGVIPSSCEANSLPSNVVWNNVDELIVADGDGNASGTTPLLAESPMCAPAGTTATYSLACNCDADATDWQVNPGFPGGVDPGTNIWNWVSHPGAPFIEEINPGSARFNIFDFFKDLASGLTGKALAS